MANTEATAAAWERLHALIDEHSTASNALLKALADVLLRHVEALAREAAESWPESKTGLYNRREVARILSCSNRTVDRLVERGELQHTWRTLGGAKCFTWEQISEYLARLNERGEERAKLGRKKK